MAFFPDAIATILTEREKKLTHMMRISGLQARYTLSLSLVFLSFI